MRKVPFCLRSGQVIYNLPIAIYIVSVAFFTIMICKKQSLFKDFVQVPVIGSFAHSYMINILLNLC